MWQFPDGSERVYLVRSDVFPDAVAGGSLTSGPILLVPRDGDLPDSVSDESARLSPTTVTVLGGPNAVSDGILIQAAQAAQR